MASRNQVGSLRDQEEPGWGFGFLSGVLIDAKRAGSPAAAGMLSWGGVYGNSWVMDPVAGLSVVVLTNTPLEGCMGAFPTDIQAAIYAATEGEDTNRVTQLKFTATGSRGRYCSRKNSAPAVPIWTGTKPWPTPLPRRPKPSTNSNPGLSHK